MTIALQNVCLVILAGGRSRRMLGQNKGLLPFNGQPLAWHVLQHLTEHNKAMQVLISANERQDDYARLGYPVIEDALPGQLGPLSGMYSAMLATQRDWILTAPCDTPQLSHDYVQRMTDIDDETSAAVAFDGQHQHSGCCLLHRSLAPQLLAALQNNQLAVHVLLAKLQARQISFADQPEIFVNINTPEQLEALH